MKEGTSVMEAAVILTKCPKTRQTFGTRIQKMSNGDWLRTWAFPVDDKRANHEGYDQETAQGSLSCTEEFPGCPYCGTKGFVQCNRCGRLTCWNHETRLTCTWCGIDIDHIVTSETFSVSGGDI